MNDIAKPTELLPCPFCGEMPEYVRAERDFPSLDEALLADPDVRCRTPKCPIRFMPTAMTLAEWNTRASQPAIPPESQVVEALHIVFDGPPGPEAGRFVECETPDGHSIKAGEWHKRSDGLWELRIAVTNTVEPEPRCIDPDEIEQAVGERSVAPDEPIRELIERVARGELESQCGSFGPFDDLPAFCTWLRRRRISSITHDGKEIMVIEVDEGGSPDPDCQQAALLLERIASRLKSDDGLPRAWIDEQGTLRAPPGYCFEMVYMPGFDASGYPRKGAKLVPALSAQDSDCHDRS